ncbi:hypothetical protein D4764_11G0001050 [Takifugu flavidus]|uniref:Uncharacterized protein n=1 Tax=Takifugu flavidus TaxID=433684 RepID=A0A5C6PDX7_9TELE|nr:hypothetical protein D4764_11G0001050 [Takifugu flavidus]
MEAGLRLFTPSRRPPAPLSLGIRELVSLQEPPQLLFEVQQRGDKRREH